MHNILQKIIEKKREDIASCHPELVSGSQMPKQVRHDKPFIQALQNGAAKKGIAVIAEIKLASPSVGILGSAGELFDRVKTYEQAGADVISIVTEKHFFNGDILFVAQIKAAVLIPVLMKDFVIDPYQIYEAKQLGADALLLIVKIISLKQLQQFVDLCFEVGIEPVVEINDEDDLQFVLQTHARIIAVNARNLETFVVDVPRACKLLVQIPDRYIRLGFSGITSHKEVMEYKNAGAKGILVGTGLMKSSNIQAFLGGLR